MAIDPDKLDNESDELDDEDVRRLLAAYAEDSRLIERKAKRSVAIFLVSLGTAALFSKGMPLHWLSFRLGLIVGLICALCFAVVLDSVSGLVIHRLGRKDFLRMLNRDAK
jgi:hypothetical protein